MSFMDEPITLFSVNPQRVFALSIPSPRGAKFPSTDYYFQNYVTISETGTDSIEITQHPIQQGASITDHAYVKPNEVRIRLIAGERDRTLVESYQLLLKFQSLRQPITVITGKRAYGNMLVRTLEVNTDKATENVLSVILTFQQIIIVPVSLTNVPIKEKQKGTSTNATEKAGHKSALKVLFSPIGG